MTDRARGYSILVVDDEENLRDGSERILSRLGHDVITAAQGEEALDALSSRPIDIVLLDLKMPGLDGLDVLDHIRSSYPDTLVIIVTGFATIETAIEAMKKGAYDFLTKPFRPEQLRLTVSRAIEHLELKEERDRLTAERESSLWAITTEKSRLRTVVDSIIPGIIITGMDKRIVMCNPSFHQMTKADPAGLIGSKLEQHPELSQVNAIVEALLNGQEDEYGGLTREFIIPGDKPAYIRATVNAVLSETGKSLGLVAVLRDVTKQREEENEKSAFVAMLTHELRSPLGAVDTQFHVILKGLAGELTEKQRDMLTRMRKRTQNIMLMINDLLDLSRIETRQFVQEKKPTDIRTVMLETVELLSDEAEGKSLSLELKQPEFMPEVLADPSALKEVATNLISNAIHYTPPGGRVKIRTGEKNGWVILEVEDTGWGIAKEYQERIFDRFFRIKDEHTRDVVGTGLGLPIVKAIVEDHKGAVSVLSEIGRGSIFRVELPALPLKTE